MEWTKYRLAHYLGQVKMVMEFKGVTGEELAQALNGEAIKRLEQIEGIVCNEYQSDSQKIAQIINDVLNGLPQA